MLLADPRVAQAGTHMNFRYCEIEKAIPAVLYSALVDSFPPRDLFNLLDGVGHKLSFNEAADGLGAFLDQAPSWAAFYNMATCGDFRDWAQRMMPAVDLSDASAKIEFSILPAHGGHMLPHPDTPKKRATAVIYLPEEPCYWPSIYGGHLEMLRHRSDPLGDFTGKHPDWGELDTLMRALYRANVVVLFSRTGYSLHGVREIAGPKPRRSVTINLI